MQTTEFDECSQHNPRIGPCLFTTSTGVMTHWELVHSKPCRARSHEDLRIDKGTHRADGNPLEHPSVEDLEGTVHIPNTQVEEPVHQLSPGPGVRPPNPGVRAPLAITRNYVIVIRKPKQAANLLDIELQIGIREEDVLAASCEDS